MPSFFQRACVSCPGMCVCVCVCLFRAFCLYAVINVGWWLLVFAVLGNHKTQSFLIYSWTSAIIYSILLIHPQTLSIYLSHTHTCAQAHTHTCAHSTLHLSSALPLLSFISSSHTHYICVLLHISSFSCLSSSVFLSSITYCPRALPSPSLTFSTCSAFPLSSPSNILSLPSITCGHAVWGGYWLHTWMTGTVMDHQWLLVCVCVVRRGGGLSSILAITHLSKLMVTMQIGSAGFGVALVNAFELKVNNI